MTTKKWLYLILFFLLIWLGFTIDWQSSTEYHPDTKFSAHQLHNDINYLVDVIRKNHPALAYYNNRFESYADSLKSTITSPLSAIEFFNQLTVLTEKINCGHTKLRLPDFLWKHQDNRPYILPVRFYFQGDHIYCRENNSTNKQLKPGMEVLKINDLSSMQIINNFKQRISSDGYNNTYKYAQMNRLATGLFPGYPDLAPEYKLVCLQPGDSTVLELVIPAQISETDAYTSPTLKAYPEFQYHFSIIDSINCGLLRISDFVPDDEKAYNDFIVHSFQQLQNAGCNSLILDVRDNDGGDPNHSAFLLKHLIGRPFVYFQKNVYGYNNLKQPIEPAENVFSGILMVLMDGGSFSSTGHLLSLLREHQRGIFVGEESGGSFFLLWLSG